MSFPEVACLFFPKLEIFKMFCMYTVPCLGNAQGHSLAELDVLKAIDCLHTRKERPPMIFGKWITLTLSLRYTFCSRVNFNFNLPNLQGMVQTIYRMKHQSLIYLACIACISFQYLYQASECLNSEPGSLLPTSI